MTWWCSASSLPWTGDWRAYPGVWLFIAALALAWWRFGSPPAGESGRARRRTYFATGLVLLWLALDWPIGALGGYLASAHAVQFILLALAAPPFVLLGLEPRLGAWFENRPGPARTGRRLAHPLVGFAGYNLILVVTHLPPIVDGMMSSQLGSFALDLGWILAGAFLWWPVLAPAGIRRIQPPLQMAYLFAQTLPSTVPAAFLVFSDFPLFRLYELAPRVNELLTPANDHQVAGLLMKTVGDPIVWIAIAVIFFRWANAERKADLAARDGLPNLASRA